MSITLKGLIIPDAVVSYLETAIWADCDDQFGINDFHVSAVRQACEDWDAFSKWIESNGLADKTAEYADDDKAAHDFWLTRNGHGAGFWDGDYGKYTGELLTAGAKLCGECTAYAGDDGKLYFV